MRGTQADRRLRGVLRGIIPAYAGNTGANCASTLPVRDHPRVCGEHKQIGDSEVFSAGSSPRMRGTQARIAHQHYLFGIIPAYAGNTNLPGRSSASGRDHPRVCGEHRLSAPLRPKCRGSSPRMRGTLFWLMNRNSVYRQKKSRFSAAFIGYGALLMPVAGFPQS